MAEESKADERFGKWRGWIRFIAVLSYFALVLLALTRISSD